MTISGELNTLHRLAGDVLDEAKTVPNLLQYVGSLAAFRERLNQYRPVPYSFELVDSPLCNPATSSNAGVDGLASSLTATGFDKGLMACEAARVISFQNWPHMDYKFGEILLFHIYFITFCAIGPLGVDLLHPTLYFLYV